MDLVVYCYVAYTVLAPLPSIDDLELRNPYINMAELYESGLVNSSAHPPILNLPRVVGQVYQSEPHKLAPQDEHSSLTPYGRMAIPDHHLQVTKDVSPLHCKKWMLRANALYARSVLFTSSGSSTLEWSAANSR